jgi:hypothetical protein
MSESIENPWLNVALEEYEGHMGPGGVEQLGPLADLFGRSLSCAVPESVAILGVAGGNGLDRIDPQITRRVVGVDLNAGYLATVRERFPALAGLELHQADLSRDPLSIPPVALVHAALIFEHAGEGRCLENAVALVAPGGWFSVVLQLPAVSNAPAAPSHYASIDTVRRGFSMLDPSEFSTGLTTRGFRLHDELRIPLPEGKGFWMGMFSHNTL